jgi:hypothetical protein
MFFISKLLFWLKSLKFRRGSACCRQDNAEQLKNIHDKRGKYMYNQNQSSSQMKGDSRLSAHHVTSGTDAGGLAFIRSACGLNHFAFICAFYEPISAG